VKPRSILVGWLLLGTFAIPYAVADCPTCGNTTPSTDSMCGPKCLLLICDRLGIKADLGELANLSGKDKGGTTLLGLSKAAEKKGLKSIGVKLGIEDLAKSGILAIAHLWEHHYVVVEPTAGGIRVTDPSGIFAEGGNGSRSMSLSSFVTRYSGFALLIAKDESSFPNIETNGPDLRFDEYICDFGFLDYGAKAERTVRFRNAGNAPLEIYGIDSSCTCATAYTEVTVLPPGGEAQLDVMVDTEGKVDRQENTLYIRSNDPISPIVRINTSLVVKPDRVLAPFQLDFGTIKVNQPAKLESIVLDPGDGSLRVESVESDSPFIAAAVSQVQDVDRGKEYPDYRLKLDLLPGIPLGKFQSKLTLRTNHPRTPVVDISVLATINGNIEIHPDTVFLGVVEQGQKATNSFKISATGSQPVMIKRIVSPRSYLSTRLSTDIEGHEYTVTVHLNGTAPTGNLEKDLVVRTDDRFQPEVKVKVYAMVESSRP